MPSALRGPDKIRILNRLVLIAKCSVVNYRESRVAKKNGYRKRCQKILTHIRTRRTRSRWYVHNGVTSRYHYRPKTRSLASAEMARVGADYADRVFRSGSALYITGPCLRMRHRPSCALYRFVRFVFRRSRSLILVSIENPYPVA